MKNVKIQPVLVGGDINCYSVARAYHEAYGVKSIAFGKIRIGATNHSKIIDHRYHRPPASGLFLPRSSP